MNWKEKDAYNRAILDKIDIKPYLRPAADVWDIMQELERDYSNTITNDPWLEGELFNFMNTGDFAYYLKKRYNIGINEEVIVNYRIGGLDGTNK